MGWRLGGEVGWRLGGGWEGRWDGGWEGRWDGGREEEVEVTLLIGRSDSSVGVFTLSEGGR